MQHKLYVVPNEMQEQLCRDKQKGPERQSQGALEGMYPRLFWTD
jgi:hypothetical protein